MNLLTLLNNLLIHHEGLELKPYYCSEGFLSIGFGRNLTINGISKDEADLMLSNDIEKCVKQAETLPWFKTLNDVRKVVILSMIYNMGLSKLLEFKKMISAIQAQDFEKAAYEMMLSRWAIIVKKRAVELALMMRVGKI